MITAFAFAVAGDPQPQPRPTAKRVGRYVRMISTPSQSKCAPFKEAVTFEAKKALFDLGIAPFAGPIFVELDCVWERTEKDKKSKKLDPQKRLWKGVGADADNVAKAVLDACNGICWLDDSQICGLIVRKYYGRLDEGAHVRISVRSLVLEGKTNGEEKRLF